MRLGLFRKSAFEGLVVTRSNGAGEAARRRSTAMIERNKLARRNEAGSNNGPNWSSLKERDLSNHTSSDAGAGSSSLDQGSSSNVGADGSSSSQVDSGENTTTTPAAQSGGIQGGGLPVQVVQSAPTDSVSQGLPTSSAKSQPESTQAEQPTQAAPSPPAGQVSASPPATPSSSSQAEVVTQASSPSSAPVQSPPPATTPSSTPLEVPPPVATLTSTQGIFAPSTTQALPLTTSLTAEIPPTSDVAVSQPTTSEPPPPAFPTSSTSISTTDVPPPAAVTTSPLVDSVSSNALLTTSAEIASSPAAATTSLSDLTTTSTALDSTSTTNLAPVQELTTDSVAAQTATSSSPIDVAQTAATNSVLLTTPAAAALPPVAVKSTAGKDTTTSTADFKTSATSNPPPPPGVTSLPPAVAPFTDTGARTNLSPAAAPFTNKDPGSTNPATAVNAHPPPTFSDIVHGAESGFSSSAAPSGPALSLQQNRPSGFFTSITPIQVADSLPSTVINGVPSNQGSGSERTGNTGSGGTGGNDVNGPNGSGISASIQNHSVMNRTTQAVGFTLITIGSIALVAGIIYLIRRVLRQRRLGKAYSPPSSPLLNAISDPLPSGIQRSMSERSAMGTGRSEFWSTSDSNTMIGPVGTTVYSPYRLDTSATYRNENGTYRSELNGSRGGGKMGAFGIQKDLNGAGIMNELDGEPKEWNLESNRDWAEKMDISPRSPTSSGGIKGSEMGRAASVRVDGMRFEMVGDTNRFEMAGDTEFKPNEKPLGRRGGSS